MGYMRWWWCGAAGKGRVLLGRQAPGPAALADPGRRRRIPGDFPLPDHLAGPLRTRIRKSSWPASWGCRRAISTWPNRPPSGQPPSISSRSRPAANLPIPRCTLRARPRFCRPPNLPRGQCQLRKPKVKRTAAKEPQKPRVEASLSKKDKAAAAKARAKKKKAPQPTTMNSKGSEGSNG